MIHNLAFGVGYTFNNWLLNHIFAHP
jgi:hypothetical protein